MSKVFPTLTANQRQYLSEMAAGKRQVNVLQSLLQNWSGVEKAVKAAENSTGSAIRENEKYLNSIEGKMKAVESAWQQLSEKTVDDNLIKGWYDLSKIFIDFQSSIGGLLPLTTLLAAIFSKQLATGITVVNEKLKSMASTANTSSKAFKTLRLSIVGIALALTAYTAIKGAIDENNKKLAESRQKTIDYGKSLGENAIQMETLYTKLNKLYAIENRTDEQESELLTTNSDLVSILGDRAEALKGLTSGTDEYRKALENLLIQESNMNSISLRNSVLNAQEALEKDVEKKYDFTSAGGLLSGVSNIIQTGDLPTNKLAIKESDFSGLEDLFSKIQDIIFTSTDAIEWHVANFSSDVATLALTPFDKSASGLLNYYNSLLSIDKATNDTREALMLSNDEKDKELADNLYLTDSYKNLQYEIGRYQENVEKLLQAKILERVETSIQLRQIPQTAEEYKVYRQSIIDSLGVTGELANVVGNLTDSLFPSLSGSVEDSSWALDAATEAVKEAVNEFDDLMGKIDSIQSAYKILSGAVDEYRSSGKLSLDTVQELLALSDEQLNALNTENGELELNKQALEELTKARLNELKASALDTAYQKIQALITEKELKRDVTEETKQYTYAEIQQLAVEAGLEEQGEVILQALSSRLGFIDELIKQTGLLSTTESEESKSALDVLNDIQTVYSSFTSATKEYAETGGLSFNTLKSILSLSPEYLKFLFDENGQISLNTETLRRYQEAKIESLRTELWDAHIAKLEEIDNAEKDGNITTEEAIEKKEQLTEEYLNSIEVVDVFTGSLGEETSTLELAQQALDDANSALDEAQSAYKVLTNAVDEYNKTGVLSVETFQSLMALSPEFLAMFFNQATAVGNAEAAIYSQAEALKVAKIEELQAAAAADILKLATGKAGEMSETAKSAVAAIGTAASIAGNKMATAAGQAAALGAGLQAVVKGAEGNLTGINLNNFRKQANAIINSYKNIASSIASISIGGVGGGKGGGGGGSKAEDQAKAISDAYDNLLSYTMAMLKKEQQDRIDKLQEELDVQEELYKTEKERIEDAIDGYKKIIDKKKESLKLDKEEKEYNDDIAEANKEISDLQNKLIELSFDTSESAKAERLKLQEELSKKETDLAKKQYNRGIDLAETALDTEYELYKEQQEQKLTDLEIAFEATKTDYEDRIDILKEYLEQENTIRSEAIALIEGRTAEFYNRLYEWNAKYGEVTAAVLQNIINKAHEAVSAVSSSGGGGGGGGGSTTTTTSGSSGNIGKTHTGKVPTLTGSTMSTSSPALNRIYATTHHSGLNAGVVGNIGGNEEFVKALKGEAFITEEQQNRFMNRILPEMLSSSNNGVRCENLLSINVSGNIDSNSVSKIQKTVENEFQKLNKVLSGYGTIRKANNFA